MQRWVDFAGQCNHHPGSTGNHLCERTQHAGLLPLHGDRERWRCYRNAGRVDRCRQSAGDADAWREQSVGGRGDRFGQSFDRYDQSGAVGRNGGAGILFTTSAGTLSNGTTSGTSVIATTNASGVASVTLTLPATKGPVTITGQDMMALGGTTVTFSATAN